MIFLVFLWGSMHSWFFGMNSWFVLMGSILANITDNLLNIDYNLAHDVGDGVVFLLTSI